MKIKHQHMWAAMYSPDSMKFATAGYNENGIKIMDAKTGELFKRTLGQERGLDV
jgi:hypothetical protein